MWYDSTIPSWVLPKVSKILANTILDHRHLQLPQSLSINSVSASSSMLNSTPPNISLSFATHGLPILLYIVYIMSPNVNSGIRSCEISTVLLWMYRFSKALAILLDCMNVWFGCRVPTWRRPRGRREGGAPSLFCCARSRV